MIPDREKTIEKMLRYCDYQERCVNEVRRKLDSFELSADDRRFIFNFLVGEGLVDDNRYARCFVRSKMNMRGWGINKIRYQLRAKGIDPEIIDGALNDIDADAYHQRLVDVLKVKAKTVKAESAFERNRKLAAYAIQKGFEPSLVFDVLKHFES